MQYEMYREILATTENKNDLPKNLFLTTRSFKFNRHNVLVGEKNTFKSLRRMKEIGRIGCVLCQFKGEDL